MQAPIRRNRKERRALDARFESALRAHNARVARETAKRYADLGDAEFRRKHNFPDVLPEPARRALADAWAIGRMGKDMPRRSEYVVGWN